MYKSNINIGAVGLRNNVNQISSAILTALGILGFLLFLPILIVYLLCVKASRCPKCNNSLRCTDYGDYKGRMNYLCDVCGYEEYK